MSALNLYRCAKTSFLTLAETLIPDADSRRPLGRICSIMRKSGAIWLLYHEHLETESYFARMYPAVALELKHILEIDPTAQLRVDQLSFFGTDIRWPLNKKRGRIYSTRKHKPIKPYNHLLGSCILIHIVGKKLNTRSYVFEAVIATPSKIDAADRRPVINYYLHVSSKARIAIAGTKVTINASYYCQQNGFSSACAHSCLKTAIWHSVETDSYQPSTAQMNVTAKKFVRPHEDDWDPSLGLTEEQCRAICKDFNTDLLAFRFEKNENSQISPYELAYLLAESGFPAIIVFKTSRASHAPYHMVPVLGHTMNTDEWFPEAIGRYPEIPLSALHAHWHEFLPSIEWAPHLIIHDDLMGPYYCLGPESLTRHLSPTDDYCGRACAVWAVVPASFDRSLSPVIAQDVGRFYLGNLWKTVALTINDAWKARITSRWDTDDERLLTSNMVLRTLIITKDAYIKHLVTSKDHMGRRARLDKRLRETLKRHYPDEMWMIEFSIPEVYCGNRAKLGEILLPLSAGKNDNILKAKVGELVPYPLSMRMLGTLMTNIHEPISLGFASHIKLYARKTHEG